MAEFTIQFRKGDAILGIKAESVVQLVEAVNAAHVLASGEGQGAELLGPFFSDGSQVVASPSVTTSVPSSLAEAIATTKEVTPPIAPNRNARTVDASKFDFS